MWHLTKIVVNPTFDRGRNRLHGTAQNRRDYVREQPSHRRAKFFALPIWAPFHPFAVSPIRAFAPSALYTPSLWRQITHPMEVDFQAIKVEELKSRLGELRRYL
jgi:hypothetical protein